MLSFIQAVHSITLCLRVGTDISVAFPHTNAMLVLIARLSFIGHEVHCFNFPSLQVYAEGENVVEMLSDDEGPIVKSSKR